jgi:hypothetical protein
LHSSVLWLRILEPYVPLRNATKRKRLRIGYICRNHNMVYMLGVNSNKTSILAEESNQAFTVIKELC